MCGERGDPDLTVPRIQQTHVCVRAVKNLNGVIRQHVLEQIGLFLDPGPQRKSSGPKHEQIRISQHAAQKRNHPWIVDKTNNGPPTLRDQSPDRSLPFLRVRRFLFSIVRIHPSRSPVLDRIYIIHYAEILTKLHARTVFDLKVFFLSPLLGLTDGDAEGAGRTQADSSSEYNPSDFVSICGSKRFSRVPGVPPLSCISLRLAEAACCEGRCFSWSSFLGVICEPSRRRNRRPLPPNHNLR